MHIKKADVEHYHIDTRKSSQKEKKNLPFTIILGI